MDTDRNNTTLRHPVEVTDRAEYDIRALRMMAVLHTAALQLVSSLCYCNVFFMCTCIIHVCVCV